MGYARLALNHTRHISDCSSLSILHTAHQWLSAHHVFLSGTQLDTRHLSQGDASARIWRA